MAAESRCDCKSWLNLLPPSEARGPDPFITYSSKEKKKKKKALGRGRDLALSIHTHPQGRAFPNAGAHPRRKRKKKKNQSHPNCDPPVFPLTELGVKGLSLATITASGRLRCNP